MLLLFESLYELNMFQHRVNLEINQYTDDIQVKLKNQVENAVRMGQTVYNAYGTQLSDWETKACIVEVIESISITEGGYIFAADFSGNTIMGPAKGENVFDIEDKNGMKVVQELIKAAQSGGGYVQYVMPDITGVKQEPKMSYVMAFDVYDWYIGAGVQLKDMDEMVQRLKAEQFKQGLTRFLMIVVLILSAVVIIKKINQKVYREIEDNVSSITSYLKSTAHEYHDMDMQNIHIEDFKVIAEYAQNMVRVRDSQEKHLEKMAYVDPITDLPNRNAFMNQLRISLGAQHLDNKLFGAVAVIDIDNFRITNDAFGHSYGDMLIKGVGARLTALFPSFFIARLGGDEFIMIMDSLTSHIELDGIMSKLHRSFQEPFHIADRFIPFSVSIGVVTFPADGVEVEDLLRKMDLAMYRAKDKGRNRYEYFDKSLLEGNYKLFYFESQLKIAIQEDQFILNYQRQVSSTTGQIVGFEALIRWDSPVLGLVMPNDFIPIAETTGLITKITELVIHKACAFAKKIEIKKGYVIEVSCNITMQDLAESAFEHLLESAVRENDITPDHLVMEITETGIFENFENAVAKIQRLREKGFKFALDDFGTGFSALDHIVELPFDIIKIDRKFVSSLHANEKSKTMIEIILDISKKINVKSVAEGVEFQEQRDILVDMGVDIFQGYYFSKPLSEKATLEQL
jgi:diguanylate cyclase (GGDEF)-like protein